MGSGPVMRSDKFDKEFFTNALKETEGMFHEFVIVKRYLGMTGGDDAAGIAATEQYASINTRACIKNITPREINYPNTIYAMGDLVLEFDFAVFGAESTSGDSQTPGRRSDKVIYRNREYTILGHVERKFLARRTYWKAVCRQVATP